MRILSSARLLACVACVLLALPAAQAQPFPNRALKIVVPFGPGTGSDVLARTIGAQLAEALGQPVVIENREGAGGLIGARAVLGAPADGYALMLAANPFVVSPLLYEQPPYDPLKDFAPVARVTVVPNVLVASNAVPVRTAKELIAYARANPGKLQYASSGVGTPSQLETELLKATFGLDILEVPYKSTAQAMTDVIAGVVSIYYPTLPAALPHIRSGKLHALGIGDVKRSPQAPDVPTLAETLDLPGYEAHTWYGFVVRAGTPADVITRLNVEIARAMRAPDVQQRVTALGGQVISGSPEEFSRQMRAEGSKWAALIRKLGLKVE